MPATLTAIGCYMPARLTATGCCREGRHHHYHEWQRFAEPDDWKAQPTNRKCSVLMHSDLSNRIPPLWCWSWSSVLMHSDLSNRIPPLWCWSWSSVLMHSDLSNRIPPLWCWSWSSVLMHSDLSNRIPPLWCWSWSSVLMHSDLSNRIPPLWCWSWSSVLMHSDLSNRIPPLWCWSEVLYWCIQILVTGFLLFGADPVSSSSTWQNKLGRRKIWNCLLLIWMKWGLFQFFLLKLIWMCGMGKWLNL